jgi:PAS domain-containing protein
MGEVLQQAAVAVTVLDLDGRIVFYNRYAPRILDRKPQYLGRDIRSFHQPEFAHFIRCDEDIIICRLK